ncbi:hypothetical protein ABIB06_006524 [Bradyrhizobium sp. LB8.2]|uniref:hypothetical protein n=1 Tax=unclassified Bradyrhizobium TaxID=2631580 RepID=UPI003395A102
MSEVYIIWGSAEHDKMRDNIALANGFQLYLFYSEKETAGFLKRDVSTLKRWRRAGMFKNKFPTKSGEDGVRYLGFNIADLIIYGTGKWPNEPDESLSSSGPTGSGKGGEALPGIAAGEKGAGPSASLSARRILRKPNSD